ncbi:MAG TPA: hypothetical protein VFH58_12420, partial [Acidimicrobiales bacterium]|nr:hypothetical protein [Acidimicrobiales bacterium]
VAPSGTDFSPCPSNCTTEYPVAVDNQHAATVASAVVSSTGGSPTNNQIVLTLATSSIAAGDGVTVTAGGVTNPQTADSSYQMQESTSADTAPASSPAYTVSASSPASITATQGGDQTATVGTAFKVLMQAEVQDGYGNPVGGATVTFTAPPTTDSHGTAQPSGTFSSCPDNTPTTTSSQCLTHTDASGLATASAFTADGTAGTYSVSAGVTTATGTASTAFALKNTSATASSVTPGTVSVSPSTAGASGATYTVTFKTNTALAAGQVIELVAPNGTTFPSCPLSPQGCANPTVTYGSTSPQTAAGVDYANATPAVGPGSSTTSATNNQIDITVQATAADPTFSGIPANTPVTVTITGAVNPTGASQDYIIDEADQADQTPVGTSSYAITPAVASKLLVRSGDGQATTVATPFAQPLSVTAVDKYGNPVLHGTPVTFVLQSSAGAGGTFPGSSTQQTDQTDDSGHATSSTITAGTVAGSWPATAELSGGNSPVGFTLTNQPGAPAKLVQATGGGQSSQVTVAFTNPLTAVAEDQYDNAVPNTPVTFTVVPGAGGAAASFAACPANPAATPVTQCVVDTDTNGEAASSAFTANTVAGAFTVTASTPAGGQASYAETNTAGPPSSVAVISGDNQLAQVGTPFASPVVVEAVDAYGNPAPGTTISFSLPASGPGASFAGNQPAASAVTDNQGRASSPDFTANSVAGPWLFTAEVSGQPSTAHQVQENNTAGPAFGYTVHSGSGQSAHVGRDFATPISVRVTDVDHNPVPGQTITFTLPTGQPTGTFDGWATIAKVTTDSDGVAAAPPVQAGLQPGTYLVTASTVVNGKPVQLQISLTNTDGYWLAGSDGSVQSFGDAPRLGSLAGDHLNQPIVGMAALPDGSGYWLVASDGGIFSFGKAVFHGSTGGVHLNQPIVGMASTPDGRGYWLVARDGGIFAFGDARFYGSTGGVHLNQPIVGMAAAPGGNGYWLVASDGGMFAFGPGARFYGSTGGIRLNKPVVGMAAAPAGNGYWLVASDGGIFAFGPGARFYGSTGNVTLAQPIVGMAAAPGGHGYWFVAHDGGIFAYGQDATYAGSGSGSGEPVVGMAEG